MKIFRSVSEKRTFRTVSDQFISREFIVSREIEIPDGTTIAMQQYLEASLLCDLRAEVLTCFVLEQMMTAEDLGKHLAPYEGYVSAAKAAMEASNG